MTVGNDPGEVEDSIEDNTSLQWFTDRAQFIRLFLHYIYAERPVGSSIYFMGDGGNGKTKLMDMLRTNFCKYIPEVADGTISVEYETYERLIQRFKDATGIEDRRIIISFLDFEAPPHGEDNPQEPFSALFMLRRILGSQGLRFPRQGLRFPRFDYAGVLYMLRNNMLQPDRVKQLFPSEEMELTTALADLFSDLPIVNSVLKIIGLARKVSRVATKHMSIEEKITLYLQGRGVDEATVQRIKAMDSKMGQKLYRELPALFAEDLNEAMGRSGAPARIVLFFDTLEALKRERHLMDYDLFKADEWLRCLVQKLALEKGIVVVVAGRDQLQWSNAPEYRIAPDRLDVRHIDQFAENDALSYLTKRHIEDHALRQAIIEYTSTAHNEVHPLLLGMSVDVVNAAQSKGEQLTADDFRDLPDLDSKERTLINLLLRYTDDTEMYAIRALSV